MDEHSGHRDRLRKRFIKDGLANFEAHNALEFLLFYAYARADTNVLAHRLINKFGSISAVFDADLGELMSIEGVGERTATLLKLMPEMSNLYHTDKVRFTKTINSTQEAGDYLVPRFIGKTKEEVHLLTLDGKRKILRCTKLFDGTVNASAISLRLIMQEALAANAVSAILAHNHPGGIAIPSTNDKRVTGKVYAALKNVSIELADHIVVADNDFVSMRDSGQFTLYVNEA